MTLRAVGANEAAVAAGVTVEEMKAEICGAFLCRQLRWFCVRDAALCDQWVS